MHDVSILDECVAITKDLKHIKSQLIVASKLSDVSQILIGASALRTRIANLQSTSNSNEHVNQIHIIRVLIDLQKTVEQSRSLEASFRRDSQAAAERQYRMRRPDATFEEVKNAIADPDAPIFQNAMLRSSRPNQASSIYDIVEQRHEDVPYIEQQFNELNLLFNEMARIVQQQKPPVVNIEEKGEVVLSNVTTANKDFSRATNVIRSYNRKKWWCALVAVLVIIIVIVVVLVVVKLAAKPA